MCVCVCVCVCVFECGLMRVSAFSLVLFKVAKGSLLLIFLILTRNKRLHCVLALCVRECSFIKAQRLNKCDRQNSIVSREVTLH